MLRQPWFIGSICAAALFIFSCGRDMVSDDDTGKPASSGISWQRTNGPAGAAIRSLFTEGNLLLAGSENGVFRSSDAGNNWVEFSTGLNDRTILGLSIDRIGRIYAGTTSGLYRAVSANSTWGNVGIGTTLVWEIFRHSSERIYVATAISVLRSDANGANWVPADSGLIGAVLDFCELGDGMLFAASNLEGVFRASDPAMGWTQTALNNEVILSIAADSQDRLYAGTLGAGLFISDDRGNSWQAVQTALLPAIVHAIAVGSNDRIFLASEDGGVWTSRDRGDSWQTANDNLEDTPLFDIRLDGQQKLFTAGRSGFVYRQR